MIGHYVTVLGAAEDMQQVIAGGLEEGRVSGSSPGKRTLRNAPQVHLNSIGAEMEDLGKSDVRALVDSAHGSVRRNIVLTTHPTRPGLSGAIGILDIPDHPPCGNSARKRRIVWP